MKGFGNKSYSKKTTDQFNNKNSSKEKILNQANEFALQGNVSEAAKCYKLFFKKGFSDASVSMKLAHILFKEGKLNEAEQYLQKAIEIKPDFAEAHYNLGIILKDLDKLKEAELSYRKAIEIKPDYSEAYYSLGNILRNLGKSIESNECYQRSLDLKPWQINIAWRINN